MIFKIFLFLTVQFVECSRIVTKGSQRYRLSGHFIYSKQYFLLIGTEDIAGGKELHSFSLVSTIFTAFITFSNSKTKISRSEAMVYF